MVKVPARMLLAIAACLLTVASVAGQGLQTSLVDTRWLEANRSRPDLLILDASSAQVYAARHIPGAVSVDFMAYGGQEKPLPEWERLYQSWGVSPGKTIVLYDQGGSYLATRVLFQLLHHGVPSSRLKILDGGLAKWQAASLPVTQEVSPARPGSFRVKAVKEDIRVKLPEFLSASGDPSRFVLLGALGPDWHFGETAPFGRPGHPPNAIMLPSADLFNPDKTFKSPDELRRMLAYLNIKPDQQIYTYCGGGVAASAPFFALKYILGYPNVKLFVESELGYLADPRELPHWTYDAPGILRDAAWVQAWGSQMIRTYTNAALSVVDVRTADAFAQGHVPFALNIAADVFRGHAAAPDKLAALLGAAGINPEHEAVIVSGGGLTKEAALAFVMLEKLGQKKVSVLTDSIERWTQLGFKLATAPTAVGPKTRPGDLTIPPSEYRVSPRAGVLVTDADAATVEGLYPRVYIASGPTVPASAPAGKVVHLPYTELLNVDGTPKPAKELWKVLAKAGIPRFGELVCISDDLGEAAVNYYILKLMGYPDIKVRM